MDLAEVYQVIYYGPDDNLRGVIMSTDGDNGAQFLFKDEDHQTKHPVDLLWNYGLPGSYEEADKQYDARSKPLIRSGDVIMLDGLARGSLNAWGNFTLYFHLFGVIDGYLLFPHIDCEADSDETLSVPLCKFIQGADERRHVMVLYAIFENAIEAHVKVKFTNVTHAFDYYGIIAASTSAITDPKYASTLFFKDPDEKITVEEPEEEIILQLSRRFVAVPLGSQLILEFGMCIDGNIVWDTLTFVAEKDVKGSKSHIVYGKGVIQVEVSWRW